MKGLIATKVGMTQVFDENGNLTPVTVIRVDPNVVVAHKTKENFGYEAVVLGLGELKSKNVTKPYAGQFPEGITPKRHLKEFRDFEVEKAVGEEVGIELFEKTHGSKFHREPGSTGQCTSPGRSFKNVKMPGRMGAEKVTVQNLKVVKVDPELKVIMVRGSVPGNRDCTLIIKSAVKK